MCGKGTATTTQNTSQTASPNPQAMTAYQNILNQAQGVAGTPYQPYTGELVAPVNQQQGTGIANINAYQPAFQTALGMAYNAAQPVNASQIAQYESPYTQQVVNATQAQFNNQNAQQQQQVLGSAAAQGALGGNRVGIAQSELANQQQLAQAPVIANLENQGYMTGLNTALTEQQAAQQGAYGVANMGQAGLQGANAQIGAGTLQQQTQQAMDQAQYQQYLNQLGYPFQTAQWLAGIDTGVGSQMGGTTTGTGTTTGPPPNSTSQWLGLGAAGLGAFGSYAGSAAGSAALTSLFAGLARGGGVAEPELPTIPESQHTLHAQQKQLVAGERHVHMFPHGTSELSLPKGMKRVASHSGVFHYNPKHISEEKIHHYARGGHEHMLLGLGPYSKHEILQRLNHGEHPVAIVERNEHGHEVRAALGTHLTAPVQHLHMSRTKSGHHTLHFEHPYKVLAERLIAHRQTGGSVSPSTNYAQFGSGYGQGVMPYSGGRGYIPAIGISGRNTIPTSSGHAPSLPQQPLGNGISPSVGKDLSGFMNGLNNLDNYSNGVNLAGLDPSTDTSGDNISAEDLAAYDNSVPSASYLNAYGGGQKFGGRVGVANYAEGGSVEPMPMSIDQMADALRRLTNAGMLDKGQAADFASARLQRLGINPKPFTGQAAPYARGGVANRDVGGDVPDDAGVAPVSDATAAIDPNIVANPPLPQPRPEPVVADANAQPAPAAGVAATPEQSSTPTPRALPRGLRNNNPGNIEDGPFAQAQPGYKGTDGRFAIFDSPEQGQAATSALLGRYGNRGINTISGIVNHWAPAADNNDTNAYIQAVSKTTGYAPNVPLDMKDPTVLSNLASAIHAHENGMPVGYTDALAARNYLRSYGMGPGEELPPKSELDQGYNLNHNGVAPAANHDFLGLSPNFWQSLMAAGFGMMASRSPYAGVAIGEGLQSGMQTYMNDQQMGLKAKQLSMQADHIEKEDQARQMQLTEQSRHNQATEAYQRQQQRLNATKPEMMWGKDGPMWVVRGVGPNGELDGNLYNLNTGEKVYGPGGPTSTAPVSVPQGPPPAPKWGLQAPVPNPPQGLIPFNPSTPGYQAGGAPTAEGPDDQALPTASPNDATSGLSSPDTGGPGLEGWAASVSAQTPPPPPANGMAPPPDQGNEGSDNAQLPLAAVPTEETDAEGLPAALTQPKAPQRDYDFLKTMNPDRAGLIQGVADYQIDPTKVASMRAASYKGMVTESEREKLMQDVRHFDPSYDMRYYTPSQNALNSFMAKDSPNSPVTVMTAGNTAIKHEAELYDLVHQIKNLPSDQQTWFTRVMDGISKGADAAGIPYASYYLQRFKNSGLIGTPQGDLLNQWALARDRYSAEVTKFYSGSGSGTQEERNASQALFDPNKSEAELKGAMARDLQMLHDKVTIYTNRIMGALQPSVWRQVTRENPEMFTMYKDTNELYQHAMANEAKRQAQQPSGHVPRSFLGAPGWTFGQTRAGQRVWKAPNGRVLPVEGQEGQ